MSSVQRQFPWVFTALWSMILITMISAGFWQLNRADEKREINSRLATLKANNPTSIKEWQQLNAFDAVEVTGQYLDTHFLLDNQIMNSQVGFFVFTVFRTVDGVLILVNRGWSDDDSQNFAVDGDFTAIQALLADWPRPGIQLGEQVIKAQAIQHLTYLDQQATTALLKQRHCLQNDNEECIILPRVLKLDPNMAAGFERQWQLPRMTVEKHLAYAVQWFSMSLVLCLVYVIFLYKSYLNPKEG